MSDPFSSGAATMQRVVVASTVMLSFISFWRAAAIVLSDLASSAYYAGGIPEQAIGKAAPWFILGIMLFAMPLRPCIWKAAACLFVGVCTRSYTRRLGDSCKVLRASPHVRLRPHRTDQQRMRRTVSQWIDQRDGRACASSPSGTEPERFRCRVCDRDYSVLLAQEHRRPARVQRKGTPNHAGDYRDGGASVPLPLSVTCNSTESLWGGCPCRSRPRFRRSPSWSGSDTRCLR